MTLRDMTDDDVTAMFRPKLDVVSLLHRLVAADTRSTSSCCSRRSPV